MKTFSQLKCISCGQIEAKEGSLFRCQTCGDLLEVVHDLDRIKSIFDHPQAFFNKRLSDLKLPYNSGVWRYHELILPELPKASIVSLGEGRTMLYSSASLKRWMDVDSLSIKHEGENPTLSFKDRGMTAGVSWAKHIGVTRIACASTGDTSAAMAAYGAAADLSSLVLLPDNKISAEQLAQPIAYGAKVLALDTDFDGCMRLVRELTEKGEIYLLNSMNPFRIEGQKAIAIETIHQRGWNVPDWFVIPVGNAGNISALGKACSELYQLGIIDRLPRIAGIQIEAANPFYQSYLNKFSEQKRLKAKDTLASAIQIGDPVSYKKAKRIIERFDGVVSEVDDQIMMEAKARCDASGINICPNSAVALAGARRLRSEGMIKKTDDVVVIATAHGAKFSSNTISYHVDEISRPYKNAPIKLSADIETIQRTLNKR